MLGAVAERSQWEPLLPVCQLADLLSDSDDNNFHLLCTHMDQGDDIFSLDERHPSCRMTVEVSQSIIIISVSSMKVASRDIPGETKDAQKDRIQQQSKIKVVKMLALVVILFVLSWLPLYAIFTILKFGTTSRL